MGKEILTFANIEIQKGKFYCHETPIFWKEVDNEKVLAKWIHLVRTKRMYFLIEDDDVLEKYNTICHKVSADIKNDLIANKNKTHGDEVTGFCDKKIP